MDMKQFLETMQHPQELKRLSVPQLQDLAQVMREKIIQTVSKTGGHLAPGLGVTELTLALVHRLNLPVDEIVWDVGHQAYPYKLLTGRYHRFDTLRTRDGLCGFPMRIESIYDSFGTGHAGTAISAAFGKALARDLKGHRNNIVAVVGDGGLTAGLSFEGLNNAGHHPTRFLVVLNDNEMSISKNVGAYHRYLNRIRMEPYYQSSRDYAREVVKALPAVGAILGNVMAKVENAAKYLFVPGVVFEELGFTYLGPVDGHDVSQLLEALDLALSDHPRPVILHVRTVKGKGYAPAEGNVPHMHGLGPFDVATGKPKASGGPPSYASVFAKEITHIARSNPRVVAITAAMPSGTGLEYFAKEIPDRFFDVGIAEQQAVEMSAGLATGGMKPVCAVYSTFLQRGYDQVIHDVCLQDLPVVFAIDRAGFVGDDGPTHMGVFDVAYLRTVPNIVVMAPKDENELRRMLHTAIAHDGPIAVRYPRGAGVGVPMDDQPRLIPIGQSETLREGKDVALLALGTMVSFAVDAAKALGRSGITAMVVNARFVKPIDAAMIARVARAGLPIVTIEEHSLQGGFGSAVLESLESQEIVGTPVKRIGIPDEFVMHATVAEQRARYKLDTPGITATVRDWLVRIGRAPADADTTTQVAAQPTPVS